MAAAYGPYGLPPLRLFPPDYPLLEGRCRAVASDLVTDYRLHLKHVAAGVVGAVVFAPAAVRRGVG